jgi:hypothetical protein
MAAPNPPPFSETFQRASSLRSATQTLVTEKELRSSYFADGRQGSPPSGKQSPKMNTPPAFDLGPEDPVNGTKDPIIPVVKHTSDVSTVVSKWEGNNVEDVFARLSPARKNILLAVFSLATALDVISVSGLLTTTESISVDLGLQAGNITWILTAYSMTFAS